MPRLVRRERRELGGLPSAERVRSQRRADECLGRRAAEAEVVAVAAGRELVTGELGAHAADERDCPDARERLRVLLALGVVPSRDNADDPGVEIDGAPTQRAELAHAQPAIERDRPDGAQRLRQRLEQVADSARVADRPRLVIEARKPQVVARRLRDLVVLNRAPIDDAQRVELVPNGRAGKPLGGELVNDARLHVTTAELGKLEIADRLGRSEIAADGGFVAANCRRAIAAPGAIEDGPVAHARDKRVERVPNCATRRRNGGNLSAPQCDERILSPKLRRRLGWEGPANLAICALVENERAIGRRAVAFAAVVTAAFALMARLDSLRGRATVGLAHGRTSSYGSWGGTFAASPPRFVLSRSYFGTRGPSLQRAFGIGLRPALELGERNEAELSAADHPDVRLDMRLKGREAHAERRGGFLAGERDSRDGRRMRSPPGCVVLGHGSPSSGPTGSASNASRVRARLAASL